MQNMNYVVTLFEGNPANSKITVALTMACNAARKGLKPVVILMGDAVTLAVPDGFESIDIGAPFSSCKALLNEILQAGGQIAVCESCMVFKGLAASDLDTRFTVIKGSDVIEFTLQAKGSLQVG